MHYCTSGCPCQSIAWTLLSFVLEKDTLLPLHKSLSLIKLLAYPILAAIKSKLYHQPSGRSLDLLLEAVFPLFFRLLPFLANLNSSGRVIILLHACSLPVGTTKKDLSFMMYFSISETIVPPSLRMAFFHSITWLLLQVTCSQRSFAVLKNQTLYSFTRFSQIFLF